MPADAAGWRPGRGIRYSCRGPSANGTEVPMNCLPRTVVADVLWVCRSGAARLEDSAACASPNATHGSEAGLGRFDAVRER